MKEEKVVHSKGFGGAENCSSGWFQVQVGMEMNALVQVDVGSMDQHTGDAAAGVARAEGPRGLRQEDS